MSSCWPRPSCCARRTSPTDHQPPLARRHGHRREEPAAVRLARGHVLDELIPTLAAAFSDGELLAAVRRELADADPLNDPAWVVERYLLAERDLGRVAPGADCRAAARLVVSICHDDAFNRHLVGETKPPRARREEIALIARSITT